MKLPYGYVLVGEEIVVHEEKADVVCSIFEYYLAGASLGKIVNMIFARSAPSPTGNTKWTRATIDKLSANKKYILEQFSKKAIASTAEPAAYTGSNLPAARRISARWPEKTCHPAGRVRQ